MLGAIIDNIVGSRYEHKNIKTKDFDLFTYQCHITDDNVMSPAIAKAILDSSADHSDLGQAAICAMQKVGRCYPYFRYVYTKRSSGYLPFLYAVRHQQKIRKV